MVQDVYHETAVFSLVRVMVIRNVIHLTVSISDLVVSNTFLLFRSKNHTKPGNSWVRKS